MTRESSNGSPLHMPQTAVHHLDLGPLAIAFHRTCRVPQRTDRPNALPASLGTFPLYSVDDFPKENVPQGWKSGAFFLPIWPHEAMWLSFSQRVPVALLVGAGMVNAITGEKLVESLSQEPQSYCVAPPQPWLDGFKSAAGNTVRQFVAARLGDGETAEEQILGSADFGGVQFAVYESKLDLLAESVPGTTSTHPWKADDSFHMYRLSSFSGGQAVSAHMASVTAYNATASTFGVGKTAQTMGLGVGGAIDQKIYPDSYLQGRSIQEVWRDAPTAKGYVYLVDARDFSLITGNPAPVSPISYETYKKQHLPWFGLQDGSWGDVEGSTAIDNLKAVGGMPDATTGKPTGNDLW